VHPKTPFEAKFSLTYTVSARIILGRVRERAFLENALSNPGIHSMEEKIELNIDPECAAKFPLHRSAKVEIEMKDGSVYKHHQHTRHGDPDEPLSDQELVDKFNELTEPRVGSQIAKTVSEGVLGAASLSVRDLAQLWSKMSY
jgi:2-methylcitrate dehydratase PrpD